MPFAKTGDINMYYEVHGSGEPIVLIAGLGIDLKIFNPIVEQLSQNFKVLVFDNRGAGLTDKPDIPYSIEMMASDTAALMKTLSIESAHVLGLSMGGRIALSLALEHPDMVKNLILASTAATIKKGRPLLFSKLIKRLRSMFGKSQQPFYAFMRQLDASRSFDCSSRLGEIGIPALILHGKKDKLAPYELAVEMHAGIKDSRLITFKGGHLFFIWENQPYIDAMLNFLNTSN